MSISAQSTVTIVTSYSILHLQKMGMEPHFFNVTSMELISIATNKNTSNGWVSILQHWKGEGGICNQATCALANTVQVHLTRQGPNNEKVHLVLDAYQAASKETLVTAPWSAGSAAIISTITMGGLCIVTIVNVNDKLLERQGTALEPFHVKRLPAYLWFMFFV